MPLITEKSIRELGKSDLLYKSFSAKKYEILTEQEQIESFDIFLSHAYMDREIIIGLRKFLMSFDYKVYIDWIDDEQMSREQVDRSTANQLKIRMNQSKCLLYAVTENYINSKWMPWELGYFDGRKGKVAVIPLTKSDEKYGYRGTEYLGLYPYVTDPRSNDLLVIDYEGRSRWLREWMNGAELVKR